MTQIFGTETAIIYMRNLMFISGHEESAFISVSCIKRVLYLPNSIYARVFGVSVFHCNASASSLTFGASSRFARNALQGCNLFLQGFKDLCKTLKILMSLLYAQKH